MRNTGRLYAFDVSARRLAGLDPRLARSGLSNVHPIAITTENDVRAKRLAGKIDRVLVDAPCSGFGTLRRNPDLKWRHGPQAIVELAEKQARILESAATLVKSGGRLVYATCSVLGDENEAVARRSFPAPYSGTNSLLSRRELSYTFTSTLFLGARLGDTELYFNPEFVQGVPFSGLHGLGGFSNGEAQRGAGPQLRGYRARLFARHT